MDRWIRSGLSAALSLGVATIASCNLDGLKFDLGESDSEPDPVLTCVPLQEVTCYTGPPGTAGVGICRMGVQQCDATGHPAGPCEGEQTPLTETCDSAEQDEDCDGSVNEEGPDCECGDGYVSNGEACDDGNGDSTDLCTTSCQPAACGDGIVQPAADEVCDPPSSAAGDLCSPTCQRQWVLTATAGDDHNCAVRNDDSVKCWGDNIYGMLGLGDTMDRGGSSGQMGDALPVVSLGSGASASALAAGAEHTCALINNGVVKCWGHNTHGQLGLGDTMSRGNAAGQMGDALPAVSLGSGVTATALAAGSEHTCALLTNSAIKCWGYNTYGQLGLGDTSVRGNAIDQMGDSLPAVNLGNGKSAKALSAGESHTCAVLDDDSVKCWGRNTYGQLGLGDTQSHGDGASEMGNALPAVALGTGRTAKALATGRYHTCALLDDGGVKCWGRNVNGQLGLGDTMTRGDATGQMGDALPEVDLGGQSAQAIAAGEDHTCALLAGGAVKCWGYNTYGQLGLGDTSSRGSSPGQMGAALPAVSLGSGKVALSIVAGRRHTCALLNDGGLKCWGDNGSGQLGLGDHSDRGDGSGEMGDDLPTVPLFSELW